MAADIVVRRLRAEHQLGTGKAEDVCTYRRDRRLYHSLVSTGRLGS
jgi:hypothetical protein